MKRYIPAVLLISMSLVFGCVQQSVKKSEDPAEYLFEQKCSRCHSINRPKSKKKTKAEWEATVNRMIKRNSASIKDKEAKIIIDYLAKNYGK